MRSKTDCSASTAKTQKMRIPFVRRFTENRNSVLNRAPANSVCAEVGVWKGDFSQRILKSTHPCELNLIDPWKYFPQYPDRWYGGKKAKSQSDMDVIYQGVKDRFATCSAVKVHRAISLDAASLFPDGYFDWIYIDGDHSYEAVLQDMQAWAPKLKPHGFLAIDDYEWDDGDDVKHAVHDFHAQNTKKFDLKIERTQAILLAI